MLSLSFASKAVCARIKDKGLHADILLYLNWDTLSEKILNNHTSAHSENKRRFVDKLMGILHNVVRKFESARAACRKRNAVEILQKFRAVDKYQVSVGYVAARLRKNDFYFIGLDSIGMLHDMCLVDGAF